jgi:hypothetical protein
VGAAELQQNLFKIELPDAVHDLNNLCHLSLGLSSKAVLKAPPTNHEGSDSE